MIADERPSLTHKFVIGELEGYLNVSFDADGRFYSIQTWVSKSGSTIAGLINSVCTALSAALRAGVPLDQIVDKLRNQVYEPSGPTNHPTIPFAYSFSDYLARYLALLDARIAVNSGIVEATAGAA